MVRGAWLVALAVGCLACSTNGGGAGEAGDAHAVCWFDKSNPPATPNPNNCVPPGAMGNEKGVGAYCLGDDSYSCQPGFVGCPVVDGGNLVCGTSLFSDAVWTARYGPQSWCLTACQTDSDCGSSATCWLGPSLPCPAGDMDCLCFPDSCTYLLQGGADAQSDAPTD
jgi:hypothetical protein